MKFTAPRSVLLPALSHCVSVANPRSTLPLCGAVLLRAEDAALSVVATELEQSVRCTVSADVYSGGSVALPAKAIHDRVAAMPDVEVTINVQDGVRASVTAKGTKLKYSMSGFFSDDFPKIPEHPKTPDAVVPAQVLDKLRETTGHAIAVATDRVNITGALLRFEAGQLTMVATDGHVLCRNTVAAEGVSPREGFLMRAAAMAHVRRLAELCDSLWLSVCGPDLFLSADGVVYSSKLVDARPPPYEQLIPASGKHVIEVAPSELADAIKRVGLVSANDMSPVVLRVKKDEIELRCSNPEAGDAEGAASCRYDGKPFSIGVGRQYMLSVLEHCESESVTMDTDGALDPLVIRDGGYLGLVMPVRI